MQDLSITQEYYICAVNEKGRISDFSTERLVCFVAAGLLDLQLEGVNSRERQLMNIQKKIKKKKFNIAFHLAEAVEQE